jgi:hypothetical protein
MKDNLILSAVHDLEYAKLEPFLRSLRATGSQARVHLFLSGVSDESRSKIEALGVTTQRFHYLHFRTRRPLLFFWPLWKRTLAARDLTGKCRLAREIFQFVALRHALNYEYLRHHANTFHQVLLTDSRDVYFQRDPFSDHLEPGLHCFLEARTQIIGTCPSNAKMVRAAFGPDGLAELASAPVSCAGTVLGDAESILTYERTMIETLCKIEKMTSSNDQAVHNYLIQRGLLPSLHLHDNYSSSVFTAGCEPVESIQLNEQNEVVRRDGTAYPILHQIDRHKGIYGKLMAKLEA